MVSSLLEHLSWLGVADRSPLCFCLREGGEKEERGQEEGGEGEER